MNDLSDGSTELEHTIHNNDMMILKKGGGNDSFNNLKVGDIVVFHEPNSPNQTGVGRISQIEVSSQGWRIIRITGFDFPIKAEQYIGKVVYVLAFPMGLIFNPISYVVSAAILGVISHRRKNKKDGKKATDIVGIILIIGAALCVLGYVISYIIENTIGNFLISIRVIILIAAAIILLISKIKARNRRYKTYGKSSTV